MNVVDIKQVGVVGGGVMGSGIAQSATVAGYRTICHDLSEDILRRTRETIVSGRFGFKGGVERGKMTKEGMECALANLTLTTKVEDLKDCDIVIEAIGSVATGQLENKDVKLRVFADLDRTLKKSALIGTNTSFFTIADLAQAVSDDRKPKVIGTHFFRPPYILKGVELIYTRYNTEDVLLTMEAFLRKLGKTPIRVKDIPGDTGFIGNRLFAVVAAEARKIVQQGVASPKDVDDVMKLGYGWTLGPFEMGAGLQEYRNQYEGKK